MDYVYEDERIPLQIRRLLIFTKTCIKARQFPNESMHVTTKSKLAFGIIYFSKSKKYVAYGSIFAFTYVMEEDITEDFDIAINSDYPMCQITVKGQPFTRPARTPLGLLID
ncbi:hypothetical protein ACTXGO_13850 [Psychrobacter sp. T6-1]|uniref:hypothetical protein n=1 Tax=Psychrobacter sp. T6-1 TaxID=3457447 RepID=UPI003FD43E43